jgi:translation initiation factor IF-3
MSEKSFSRVNNQIRSTQVTLIDQNGNNLGTMTADKARYLSRQEELDLVEVAPMAKPPVCRIMDYGKFKYEQSIKEKKTKPKKTQLKEIRLRPVIGENDLNTRIKALERFIEEGDKVQIQVKFSGRENEHKDLGFKLIERIVTAVSEIAVLKTPPVLTGKHITCVLTPKK